MDSLFVVGDDADAGRIDLDSLYSAKKTRDLGTIAAYRKVLGRVHSRIKCVSRVRGSQEFCWYIVPEMIIGLPKFDNAACIAYIINELKVNGFVVRYTHPNLLFISWKHWTPDYVRSEFRRRTGIAIDGLGNRKPGASKEPAVVQKKTSPAPAARLRDISSYQPTGKLLYSKDLLPRLKTGASSE